MLSTKRLTFDLKAHIIKSKEMEKLFQAMGTKGE